MSIRVCSPAGACAVALVYLFCDVSAQAQTDTRVNATVKAVRKVKPSIVAIKAAGSNTTSKKIVGTGVIVDERGYIVTNRHVIAGAEAVSVRLADESELVAQVVLADKNTDLAVLKVNPIVPLPALPLARSDDLEVGEDVFAVGHPHGYSFTVTRGIISALGRKIELPTGAVLSGLIQTDAAINPGNSGGPLLNVNGEFIGINTALRDGANGIAFAINTGTIKSVLSDKLSALKVAGISHGLKVQEKAVIGDDQAAYQRVIVASLSDASAAAGLQKGDVICGVGKLTIGNSFDLERALWDARPGQRVTFRILRSSQELQVNLILKGS
jgi:serine protease Do